jgi:hypothetical protein
MCLVCFRVTDDGSQEVWKAVLRADDFALLRAISTIYCNADVMLPDEEDGGAFALQLLGILPTLSPSDCFGAVARHGDMLVVLASSISSEMENPALMCRLQVLNAILDNCPPSDLEDYIPPEEVGLCVDAVLDCADRQDKDIFDRLVSTLVGLVVLLAMVCCSF